MPAQGNSYERVRAFLAEGLRPDFAARVFARVESKAADWDHSYEWASLSALIADGMRQAEDTGGYCAVIAARLEHDGGEPFAARRARALLTAAAQRASEADVMLAELRRLVERAA